MWEECPFAEDDLLDMPKKQRPVCVYERLEYDALVEQYIPSDEEKPDTAAVRAPRTAVRSAKRTAAKPHLHLVHTVALLQVMMSRAATVVSTERFTEKTSASGKDYAMESSKVSASLDAFLRLAREHRHYHRELSHTIDRMPEPKPLGWEELVKPLLEQAEGVLEASLVPDEEWCEEIHGKGPYPPPELAGAPKKQPGPRSAVGPYESDRPPPPGDHRSRGATLRRRKT